MEHQLSALEACVEIVIWIFSMLNPNDIERLDMSNVVAILAGVRARATANAGLVDAKAAGLMTDDDSGVFDPHHAST